MRGRIGMMIANLSEAYEIVYNLYKKDEGGIEDIDRAIWCLRMYRKELKEYLDYVGDDDEA